MKKLFIIGAGIVLAAVLFFFVKVEQFYKYIYTPRSGATQPKKEKTDYSVLLLGYGGETHEGANLTDTMIVVHIDTKKKSVHLISLPRDMWVRLPTKSGSEFHTKLNAVYETELFPQSYPDVDLNYAGSKQDAALTKYVVGQIAGLPIDYYLGIDFAGFEKAIDLIGGVDITVEKTFDDYEYPIEGKEKELCDKDEDFKKIEPYLNNQGDPAERDKLFKEHPELEKFFKDITDDPLSAFPCRYEHLHFEAGKTHMDGKTALKYVRSRHSLQDGSDFGRAARQQNLIQAVRSKVLTIGFIPHIIPLLDEMKKYIRTDIGPDDVSKFVKFAPTSSQYNIKTYVPSTKDVLTNDMSDDGQFILAPTAGIDQWGEFKKAVKFYIADITPTPTPTPTLPIRKITP